jgi:nitroreductase
MTPMLNDRTSLLAHLDTRRSGKPREMIAPGPSATELHDIIAQAMRSPDHGKLTPWRFIEIAADQRSAFADLLKKAWIAHTPGAANLDLSALDQFAHQAPNLVVLLSTPIVGSKIPLWEQQLSAGAVAMNLLHAAHARGFVGSWITGWAAFDPTVKAALGGAETDQIAGYFFIGSPAAPLEERPRPNVADKLTRWTPPA